jgi:hypothetical protein
MATAALPALLSTVPLLSTADAPRITCMTGQAACELLSGSTAVTTQLLVNLTTPQKACGACAAVLQSFVAGVMVNLPHNNPAQRHCPYL